MLVLDQAGWHDGYDVRVPEHVISSSYRHSPELQPASTSQFSDAPLVTVFSRHRRVEGGATGALRVLQHRRACFVRPRFLVVEHQNYEEADETLWQCRMLYNTALEERITAYRRCGVTLSRSQQEAELKDMRAACPAYAALHSHVLQDVLARLDKT